jgi:hypothetical protein
MAFGAALVAAGRAAADAVVAHGGLAILNPDAVAAFLPGLLFGWAGIAGATASFAVSALVRGSWTAVLSAAAVAVFGLAAHGAFGGLRGCGRRLPDLRSYGALLASAAAGGLGYALLKTLASSLPLAKGLVYWWASSVASVVVLTPPLVAVLVPALGRWLAPIPGERQPIGFRRWRPVAGERSPEGEPTAWEPVPSSRLAAAGPIVATLAITLVMALAGTWVPAGWYWLNLLFVAPILWAGSRCGLRGGLLVAALVGVCHLAVSPLDPTAVAAWHRDSIVHEAGLVLFSLFGALWGSAQQREALLRDQLAQANRRLRRDFERTVRALSSAIAAKDAYTDGHLQRVASYAVDVGRRLGMGSIDLERLEVASLLHDLGKIGVPERILAKPGPLDAEERAWVERHPEIGASILADLEGLAEVAPLVRHHQERFDGRREGLYPGYPAGLCGDQIPLGARIIAVVDAFDAMTSDRAYRPALSRAEALATLGRERARQFDPEVVDAFFTVLAARPW